MGTDSWYFLRLRDVYIRTSRLLPTDARYEPVSVHGRHSFVPKEVDLHSDKESARPREAVFSRPLSRTVCSGRVLVDAHPGSLKPKSDEPR